MTLFFLVDRILPSNIDQPRLKPLGAGIPVAKGGVGMRVEFTRRTKSTVGLERQASASASPSIVSVYRGVGRRQLFRRLNGPVPFDPLSRPTSRV